MINVVGIKFKCAGKVYYFDPKGIDVILGDNVIVETSRGTEFGTVVLADEKIKKEEIVSPLKKIIRKANDEDKKRHETNIRKKEKAIEICQDKVKEHKLDMKLIDVEYTFDNSKVIFYFTSDGRVDFRNLVKDLAAIFKMRIELRQIGVRDEAKMLGGIGNCGKGLCCHQWLSEFHPVTIKMAKVQGLSLNPTKISGVCGRLMCCLKYENDVYLEMRKGIPEVGEKIITPEGAAIVIDTFTLDGKIKARLIIEEGDSSKEIEQKLSTEIMTCYKTEIKRVEHKQKRKKNIRKESEEVSDEIKELLKD